MSFLKKCLKISKFLRSYFSNYLTKSLALNSIFSSHNETVTRDLVSASVTRIKVYYDDLYYNVVEESPSLTADSLLGLIGGQIGLFIGVSLMTFFEIFEFWIELFIRLFKQLNQPNGRIDAEKLSIN